ncbi:MAG TPA: hypothetical protein VFN97_22920 [Actinospica sp.]|nr:hypothetical protein [Actinospica sp.]
METTRARRAGLAAAFALALTVAGCASGSSSPVAVPSPSSTTSTPAPKSTGPSPVAPSPTPSTHRSTPTPTRTPPPPSRVVLSRVSYAWGWPNAHIPTWVRHSYPVPPVPELVRIGVGDHSRDSDGRPYDRMTFTFTTAFPSYWFEYADALYADPGGARVPLKGYGLLRIAFRTAQAHTETGRSSITAQPDRNLGLSRMVDYARAGDFEGILVYGIGITWPIPQSNPQIPVRVFEVETVTATGQHLYTVAVDIDATDPGR